MGHLLPPPRSRPEPAGCTPPTNERTNEQFLTLCPLSVSHSLGSSGLWPLPLLFSLLPAGFEKDLVALPPLHVPAIVHPSPYLLPRSKPPLASILVDQYRPSSLLPTTTLFILSSLIVDSPHLSSSLSLPSSHLGLSFNSSLHLKSTARPPSPTTATSHLNTHSPPGHPLSSPPTRVALQATDPPCHASTTLREVLHSFSIHLIHSSFRTPTSIDGCAKRH